VFTSLLTTKLYFPPVRSGLVSRPRLVERLQQGLKGPLTLISAPAGYGKTTLMGEWRASLGSAFPVAWFSIDNGDNNQFRFWGYVTAALSSLDGSLANNAISLMQSSQFPPVEEFITPLVNSISGYTKDFALVLDDYHTVTAPEIHQYLTFLLEHLPKQMHLVLLTRADPALPLARLRARGQLTELRADDLRFTVAETAEFLNDGMRLELPEEKITALEQRTEGWIAGLQMAALAMQGKQDIDNFIEAFTGSHRYILDYLAEDVLGQQPETIQNFLLCTSILNRLNGSLCDAVLGQQNSEQTLAELDRRNLFLIPLDNERRWYRYQHLFAEAMQSHLRQWKPGLEYTLRRLAAEWFATQDLEEEAISYALAAQDFPYAASLLEENCWKIIRQGHVSSLLTWIAALPAELPATRPHLRSAQAYGLFISGREDEMLASMQQIEEFSSQNYTSEETLLQAIAARWNGDADRSFELSQIALEQLPTDNPFLLSQAWFNLGMLHREQDVFKSQQAFARAGAFSESYHDVTGALKALFLQGKMLRYQGALRKSSTACVHALLVSEKQPFSNGAGFAHLGMAEILYEQNELEQAGEHLQNAMEIAQKGSMNELKFDVSLMLARLHSANKAWTEAQNMIDQAEQLAWQAQESCSLKIHNFLMLPVAQAQFHLWLAQGKEHEADQWLSQHQLPSDGAPLFFRIDWQTSLARFLILQGKLSAGLSLIDEIWKEAQAAHILGLPIQIQKAVALYANGETEASMQAFSRALELAEPENTIRTFIDMGEPIRQLLRHAGSRGIAPRYAARLLSEFDRSAGSVPAAQQPLIEPLSRRELEILRLVVAGKSNQEIADDLVLALGTVKRHVSNIFLKLNVESRTRCIARARELQLI
jgi:LuxR family transcriptional regulator, maltose regulon positive regulatory protein